MTKVFAKVSNVAVRNPNLSPTARTIYTYICFNGFDEEYVQMKPYSLKELLSFTNLSSSSRNLKQIKESLSSLVDLKSIEVFDSILMLESLDVMSLKENDLFYIKATEKFYENLTEPYDEEMEGDKGFFTAVYKEDFIKFISLSKSIESKSINIPKLMTAYLVILSRANIDKGDGKSNKVSFETTEDLSSIAGLNKKTFEKYVKLLCDLQLIFKLTVRVSSIKRKNVYARWCDRNMPVLMGDENKSHVFTYINIVSINGSEISQSDASSISELLKMTDVSNVSQEWVDSNVLSILETD